MKISELKLEQEITINGFQYQYKGIHKIRITGFGRVEKIVFKGIDIDDNKYFDLSVLSKDLKLRNGKLEF